MITVIAFSPSEPSNICVTDDGKPLVYLRGPMSLYAAGAFIMSMESEGHINPDCINLAIDRMKK